MTKTKFRAGTDSAALTENIETLTGQRGDGKNKAVTYDDLVTLGLANLKRIGGQVTLIQAGDATNVNAGGSIQKPPRPTGFNVTGGFAFVLLEWDMPNYRGRSLTEIYRSPDDNLADAVLVASSAAGVYSDPVDPAWKGYYWIRHVNSLGIPGPYNSAAGTYAETKPDVAAIVDLINDEINTSPLIDGLASGLKDAGVAVKTNAEAISNIDEHGSTAYQAMWSTKAQAGEVTAGIGIVAGVDSSGKAISQVAIAASQFFVFNPNNPDDSGYATPFVINSDGKVIIDELVAKEAVIKILTAQQIVADSVKAGIEIVSPYIKTARIESGGFTVDPLGNARFGQLVSISASGQLMINSSTNNTGMKISNDRLDVVDDNGVLRVRVGRL